MAKKRNVPFAEAEGSEANQHAKALAQEKSKKKATPAFTYYTQKGVKILKLIVKPGKTHSVYVGQLTAKKHKAALEPMIAGWKKEGVWLSQDECKEKLAEVQASFLKK